MNHAFGSWARSSVFNISLSTSMVEAIQLLNFYEEMSVGLLPSIYSLENRGLIEPFDKDGEHWYRLSKAGILVGGLLKEAGFNQQYTQVDNPRYDARAAKRRKAA